VGIAQSVSCCGACVCRSSPSVVVVVVVVVGCRPCVLHSVVAIVVPAFRSLASANFAVNASFGAAVVAVSLYLFLHSFGVRVVVVVVVVVVCPSRRRAMD
jgi:hypothetical protein